MCFSPHSPTAHTLLGALAQAVPIQALLHMDDEPDAAAAAIARDATTATMPKLTIGALSDPALAQQVRYLQSHPALCVYVQCVQEHVCMARDKMYVG